MPLKEAGDSDDSDFYGIRNDSENKASQRQLELEKELKFEVRYLETYGGETQEWGDSQLHYGNIKRNLKGK